MYKEDDEQEELLTHCGAFCILTERRFQCTLKYFNKALEVNPAASILQVKFIVF